jgi:hypothetical protein
VCDPYDRWGLKYDMVHISPWKCTESLFANAAEILKSQGRLFMYGPFAVDGKLEPKSNQEFDTTYFKTK